MKIYNRQRINYILLLALSAAMILILAYSPSRQFIYSILSKMTKANFTILISSLALIISILNFIEKYKPAEIITSVSENLVVVKRTDDRNSDLIHIPVTFTNIGFNHGVVKKCQIEIVCTNGADTNLKWIMNWVSFCKTEGGNWKNESIVFPISLSGKSSFSKIITFSENISLPFYLDRGEYSMVFRVWIYGKEEVYSENKYLFSISEEKYREYSQTSPSQHTNIKISES